ncbi:hypothetical protein NUACC21_09190 [Scytonema sp. NUACC21]
MKDNFSLIAAAAGGFMLSVALTGILHGSPVVSWQAHSTVQAMTVTTLRPATDVKDNEEFFNDGGNG